MKRHSEQEMLELYAKWQKSGKTKIAFCKEEGIVKSTFYYWAKKCHSSGIAAKEDKPAFAPLVLGQVLSRPLLQPSLRINYHTGVSIDFFDAPQVEFIKELCR